MKRFWQYLAGAATLTIGVAFLFRGDPAAGQLPGNKVAVDKATHQPYTEKLTDKVTLPSSA